MWVAAAAAKSLQLCPTLWDPIDGSPPGSPIPGILQARTLEWVAISFSNAWKKKVKVKLLSHVRLLTTPWTPAHQAPLSMGFSRQEYWSGVPLPSLKCRLLCIKNIYMYIYIYIYSLTYSKHSVFSSYVEYGHLPSLYYAIMQMVKLRHRALFTSLQWRGWDSQSTQYFPFICISNLIIFKVIIC